MRECDRRTDRRTDHSMVTLVARADIAMPPKSSYDVTGCASLCSTECIYLYSEYEFDNKTIIKISLALKDGQKMN